MTDNRRQPWTTCELTRLQQNYENCNSLQLKAMFPNRTIQAIRSKALSLGLVSIHRVNHEFKQGQQCGKLTLQSCERRPDKYNVKHRHWTCVCQCGQTIELTDQHLMTGLFQSCPNCMDLSDLPELKTKLGSLLKETCNKHNAIGVRGVYLDKKSGKYAAYIQIQGRRIRLGQYKTLEMASDIRNEFVKSLKPMLTQLWERKGY